MRSGVILWKKTIGRDVVCDCFDDEMEVDI